MTETLAERESRATWPGEPVPMTVMPVMADSMIDPEHPMLEGIDTSAKPLFTVKEMAMFFFARSPHWIRMLEARKQMGVQEPDGTYRPVGTRRNGSGARVYTLSDVEEIAHVLASNGAISGARLRQTLTLVKIQAEMHQYL